ncbi:MULTISPECIES: stage II sporulation protein M [Bacillales]|uniref:stage II sporulation protein M n=1 Tax=Bacillales TaxID=1385 RepID=UPI0018842512|nr:stage II sporulation protein M [Pseudalkalibacillus hwajinpoensis]MBF0709090.1 stage II sporulation protein M [Pseudalkalibacillus hwajinpoensis]WLR60359.1 stage II sporulation protein M [Pseudalkalibacillus hwajinpoensis]
MNRSRHLKQMISTHLSDHLSLYTFIAVLFLMGIVFGAVIVNSLSFTQKEDLAVYLGRFFGQVSDGQFATSSEMFHQSLTHYAKYIGLMWLLGLTIIGLPIVLIMLFLKGIVVGFTVGFLVNQMSWKGFLLAFVSVFPQNIIAVPAMVIVATASLTFSLRLMRQLFMKRRIEPILPPFLRFSGLVICALSFLCLAAWFEAYLSPGLIKAVVEMK